jgi:hypothetical protein
MAMNERQWQPTSSWGNPGRGRTNGWSGGKGLKSVGLRGRATASPDGVIREVTCGFGGTSKVWWALHPPHGKGEGEGHEVDPRSSGECNPEFGDVGRAEWDLVEAVSDVNLGKAGWPKPGVTVDGFREQALQGASKLHGLWRGQAWPSPVLTPEKV